MARKRLFRADLARGQGVMADTVVDVAVPVLIWQGEGPEFIAWQSDNVYPAQEGYVPMAKHEIHSLQRVMVEEWPAVAGEVDWWTDDLQA